MRGTQQWQLARLRRRLRSGRVVEVRVSATVFADTLGTMREWLDRNSVIPVRFEHATERNEKVLILVDLRRAIWRTRSGVSSPTALAAGSRLPSSR